MPDHIHLILYVETDFVGNKNLGTVISGFKGGGSRAYLQIQERKPVTGINKNPNLIPQFEEGYNDRILSGNNQLKLWQNYLKDNPRRLAIKRKYKDFFTSILNFIIKGNDCQIYGNRFFTGYSK